MTRSERAVTVRERAERRVIGINKSLPSVRYIFMRTIFTVLIVMTFCTTSQAAERWEGIWAQTRHECADKEGPSSRTLIDLSNKEKGQLAPIYDQYENHCRIKGVSRKDGTVILHITCFEFWQDYKNKRSSRPVSVKIVYLDQQHISIDGERYQRCRD